MKKIFIFFILLQISFPTLVFAVREIESSGNFIAEVRPENPSPGERVIITLKSFGFNLQGNFINWYLDNKLQDSYTNKKQFSFFVGKAGTSNQVKIIIKNNQYQMSKTLIFEPAEVNLVWQAGTEVPNFYRGKALPTPESLIKIWAIPNIINSSGKKTLSENLSYRWYINGNLVSNSSGIGRNTFLTSANKDFTEKIINVLVSDSSNNLVAENSLSIKPQAPKIIFYESKPLEGIDYNNALSNNLTLINQEITIKAQPYFFGLNQIGQPSFSWLLNNQKFTPPNDNSLVTFRYKPETEGLSKINLVVANSNSTQKAISSLLINFNKQVIDFNNDSN
ncbi:MAG: hypothetical protein WC893_00725 [Candidatus Paceibacterota bacterium]|jgi:hypothetical protein